MDFSAGFSLMEAISPLSGVASSPMTNLLYFLAILFFLLAGGHLLLIMALAESYRLLPVGGGTLNGRVLAIFSHLAGDVFSLGLTVAAPVVGALFFAMVAFSLLSRAIPQLNIFQVGFSLQNFLGIVILLLALPAFAALAGEMFRTMFNALFGLMGAMGG
jgi:flagellar biosynthetic protein FliR